MGQSHHNSHEWRWAGCVRRPLLAPFRRRLVRRLLWVSFRHRKQKSVFLLRHPRSPCVSSAAVRGWFSSFKWCKIGAQLAGCKRVRCGSRTLQATSCVSPSSTAANEQWCWMETHMKLSLLTWIYTDNHDWNTQLLIEQLVTANTTIMWLLSELVNTDISHEDAAGNFPKIRHLLKYVSILRSLLKRFSKRNVGRHLPHQAACSEWWKRRGSHLDHSCQIAVLDTSVVSLIVC